MAAENEVGYTTATGSLSDLLTSDIEGLSSADKKIEDDALILFGCAKDITHAEWIFKNKKYNIRTKSSRPGSINKNDEVAKVRYLILYSIETPSLCRVFELKEGCELVDEETMRRLGYINPKDSYLVYDIASEITSQWTDLKSKDKYKKDVKSMLEEYKQLRG